MIRLGVLFFSIAFFSLSASASASNFLFNAIDIPPRFTGPVRATPDVKSETAAFSAPRADSGAADVIQFTRYDLGSVPPNLSEQDLP